MFMYYACLRIGEAVKSATDNHTLKAVNTFFSPSRPPTRIISPFYLRRINTSKSLRNYP